MQASDGNFDVAGDYCYVTPSGRAHQVILLPSRTARCGDATLGTYSAGRVIPDPQPERTYQPRRNRGWRIKRSHPAIRRN
jgi:hypothetical protein